MLFDGSVCGVIVHDINLFLFYQKDKKTDDGPNQLDLSVEDPTLPKEESTPPARPQIEEKSAVANEKEVSENSTEMRYQRTSEVKETIVTNTVNGKVLEQGNNEKKNKSLVSTANNNEQFNKERSREPLPKEREVIVPRQGTDTTNIQYKSQNDTKEHVLQGKTNSRSIEVPSQILSGRRQLPADPRIQQATKDIKVVNSNHASQGVVASKADRTPVNMSSSELSSNSNSTAQSVTSVPKSTKTRAAPPVPRSSGSTGSRNQVPLSDTSGYPESFSKRKSRDSREISDTALQQLGRFIQVPCFLKVAWLTAK